MTNKRPMWIVFGCQADTEVIKIINGSFAESAEQAISEIKEKMKSSYPSLDFNKWTFFALGIYDPLNSTYHQFF